MQGKVRQGKARQAELGKARQQQLLLQVQMQIRVSKKIKFFGMEEHYPPGPLYTFTEPPKKISEFSDKN